MQSLAGRIRDIDDDTEVSRRVRLALVHRSRQGHRAIGRLLPASRCCSTAPADQNRDKEEDWPDAARHNG